MDYIKLGSPEKAAPYLLRALELNPSSQDAHEAMALYYLTKDNVQGAEEQYRKAADLDPDKSEALFKVGHEYLDLGARLAYRGARLYPDSPWGHRFLGDTLLERVRDCKICELSHGILVSVAARNYGCDQLRPDRARRRLHGAGARVLL